VSSNSYDLSDDIGERRNVQHLLPEEVRRLADLIAKYVGEGPSTPGTPQVNTGPQYWPQLRWMT